MSISLSKEVFFKEFPIVQNYLEEVAAGKDKCHQKIMQIARERIHPPSKAKKHGFRGQFGNIVRKVRGPAADITHNVFHPIDTIKSAAWKKYGPSGQLKQKEITAFIRKWQGLIFLKDNALKRKDEKMLKKVEELQTLLYTDQAIARRALTSLPDNVQEEERVLARKTLEKLAARNKSSINDLVEKVLEHDITESIGNIPLRQLHELKKQLSKPSEENRCEEIIQNLQKLIETGEKHVESRELLKQIEGYIEKKDYTAAKKTTNLFVEHLVIPMLSLFDDCITQNRQEFARTILNEVFKSNPPSWVLKKLKAIEDNPCQETFAGLAEVLEVSSKLESKEQESLESLRQYLKMDPAEILFRVLQKSQRLNNEDLRETTEGILEHLSLQQNQRQLECIESFISYMEKEGETEKVPQDPEVMKTLKEMQAEVSSRIGGSRRIMLKALKDLEKTGLKNAPEILTKAVMESIKLEGKPWLLERLEGFMESEEEVKIQTESFNQILKKASGKFEEPLMEDFRQVRNLLAEGQRFQAKEKLAGIAKKVSWTENRDAETTKLIEEMRKCLAHDPRNIAQHLTSALHAIISGGGEDIMGPLANMSKAIAENQGKQVIQQQLQQRVTLLGKAAKLDTYMSRKPSFSSQVLDKMHSLYQELQRNNRVGAENCLEALKPLLDDKSFDEVKEIVESKEENTLSQAIVNIIAASVADDGNIQHAASDLQVALKEEGQKALLTQLNKRLEGKEEEASFETLILKVLKGALEESKTPLEEETTATLMKKLANEQLQPWLEKRLSSDKTLQQLGEQQAKDFDVLIDKAASFDLDEKAKLQEIRSALANNERAEAKKMMRFLTTRVAWKHPEEEALLREMERLVAKDPRDLSQHLMDALHAIVKCEGEDIQGPLTEMAKAIAENQGKTLLEDQIKNIQNRVAMQGRVKNLDEHMRQFLKEKPGRFSDEQIKGMVEISFLLGEGKSKEAKQKLENLGLPLEDFEQLCQIIAPEQDEGLSVAIVNLLASAVSDTEDIETATRDVENVLSRHLTLLREEGKKTFIKYLQEGRTKAKARGEEGFLQIQLYDSMLAALGAEEIDLGDSLKDLFYTAFQTHGKSWMLTELDKMKPQEESSPLAQNSEELKKYLDALGDSSPLSRENVEFLHKLLLEEDREGAIGLLNKQIVNVRLSGKDKSVASREIKVLRTCLSIVEKDHSGLQEKVRETLERIIDKEGCNLVEELTNMFARIAKNEGIAEMEERLSSIRASVESKEKVNAFHKTLLRVPGDKSSYAEPLQEIQRHLEKEEYDQAKTKLKELQSNKALFEAISNIIDTPQATIQKSLIDTFYSLLKGENVETPLLNVFQEVKTRSDQMFFEEIADTLEQENGLEELIKKFASRSEAEKSSIPANLNRIFQFLISDKGQTAIGNVVAFRIVNQIMGKEVDLKTLKQEEFNAQCQNLFEKLLFSDQATSEAPFPKSNVSQLTDLFQNWAFEGGGLQWLIDRKVFEPLLEKIKNTTETEGLQKVFENWFHETPEISKMPNKAEIQERLLSTEGSVAFAKALLNGYAEKTTVSHTIPTRAILESRKEELSKELQKIGEGPEKMAKIIVDIAIKKIEEKTQQQATKKEAEINIGRYVVKPEEKESHERIYFAKMGPIALGMDREDFKLALEVAIKETLLEGNALVKDAAGNLSGYDFTCDLAGEALQALMTHLKNPGAPVEWDDEQASRALFDRLAGENGKKLQIFSPFTQQAVTSIVSPSPTGQAPFRLLGVKPIGPNIIQQMYRGNVYMELFDDVLANRMKERFEEIAKEGNLYDYMFRSKRGPEEKVVLSEKEQLLKKRLGEFGLALFQQLDPHWASELEGMQWQDKLADGVGDLMMPVLRDYMKLELGTENPQDITVEMMYDYALKKGAQSLENVAEGKSISEEELEAQMDKAIENLGAIAYLAKPLLKHRSFAGLIIGGIGHFLLKVTLNPIIGLISRVVKGISDRKEKDYTKTIWYRLTEGRKKAHEKRDAREKIYKPIREIVQSDRLWQRIYNRIATTQNPKIKTEQTPS